MIFTGIRHFRH